MEDKIIGALDTIVDTITHIAIPLYGCVAVICLIMILASSGRKAEMAKDWLIRATIAAVAIGCIDMIKNFVMSLYE